MARKNSIGAIPSQTSAEMQQILIAMKQAIETLQADVVSLRGQLAAAERRITALE